MEAVKQVTLPGGQVATESSLSPPTRPASHRPTPHERLLALGLKPIGRASEFADEIQA